MGEPNNPYRIATAEDMNTIGLDSNDWDKHFKLTADIDLGSYTGTAFNIIGDSITPFSGVFDGNGHAISNFTYNCTGTDFVGIFGDAHGSNVEIKDLGIINPDVNTDCPYVGALAGSVGGGGSVSGCYVEGGTISGNDPVGGLVGYIFGTISNCNSSCIVSGDSSVGGLVGYSNGGTILGCSSAGSVSGTTYVGGLVGDNTGTISNCYSTCSVFATGNYVGGLAAFNSGDISNSYSRGSVEGGGDWVGGLTGYSVNTLTNCYSTSSVIGDEQVGGLVGKNFFGTVSKCYSVGSVTGAAVAGGLVGATNGAVEDSFWDIETSLPATTSAGGTGKSTADMQTKSTFTSAGWDFVDIWDICDGTNYPKLVWQIPMHGDFVCPDGVDMDDLDVFVQEWLLPTLSADVAPDRGDGFVDFLDWATFADAWRSTPSSPKWNPECDIAPPEGDDMVDPNDLGVFIEQWLQSGACCADVVPAGGDGIVNLLDFAALADNWLTGL